MAIGSVAIADGYRCHDDDINVAVYNHVKQELETSNGAVMILSDPRISEGRKTIATFSDAKNTLSNKANYYVGKVDLRVTESGRAGELILGTKLGKLKKITLSILVDDQSAMVEGEETDGTLTLHKRNGDVEFREMICTRYLSN